jgi:hypothetical protein
MVVAGEFTEIQARLVLGGHHHPFPLGYFLHEGPHLRRPVHQGLGLLVGETLLQHPADQVLSISQQAEINIQALPSYIHPALIEEFRLVLAAGSGADQPEGHGSSSWLVIVISGIAQSSLPFSFLLCSSNNGPSDTTFTTPCSAT